MITATSHAFRFVDLLEVIVVRKLFAGLLTTLALASISLAQSEVWRKVSPLQSTRQEVEKLIGRPASYFETYGIYKGSPELIVSAWYSTGRCDTKDGAPYRVAAGTLTRLYITFLKKRKLSLFEPDLRGFTKIKHDDKDDFVYYYSADESLIYKTYLEKDGSELVFSVSLQPTKDKKSLLCHS